MGVNHASRRRHNNKNTIKKMFDIIFSHIPLLREREPSKTIFLCLLRHRLNYSDENCTHGYPMECYGTSTTKLEFRRSYRLDEISGRIVRFRLNFLAKGSGATIDH
eukprot:scaffold6610_cov163-Amphora_coffeaeformis.AAC.4